MRWNNPNRSAQHIVQAREPGDGLWYEVDRGVDYMSLARTYAALPDVDTRIVRSDGRTVYLSRS